jgi:hypothetical protein
MARLGRPQSSARLRSEMKFVIPPDKIYLPANA